MSEYLGGMIVPEDIDPKTPGYKPGHWNYRRRCADVELGMAEARTRIEEWDQEQDAHGWWHERTGLIAMHNEIIRLRHELAQRPREAS